MNDSYLKFANTRVGVKLTSMLGLPQPIRLERGARDQIIDGAVCIEAADESPLLEPLLKRLKEMGVDACLSSDNDSQCREPKALLFDATGLKSSENSLILHQFFSQTIKSLQSHGRVIVFGRPPEHCKSSRQATVQRALEGLTRALAKELRKAITVQLVYVAQGAEENLESTLRFLLSPQSAYVSGQVIRIGSAVGALEAVASSERPLADKKVLVTGASQGIGLAIAKTMAQNGAHVICLDVPTAKEALQKVAKELAGKALMLDLTADDAAEVICAAAEKDGGWDVIVHNAGITKDKTMAKMPADWWSLVVDVNLSAQERINDALLRSGAINVGGRIICVSSISGIAGNRGQTNYAFSKAGVIGMVESLAPRVSEKGVTINAVAPGFIETEMTSVIPFGVREAGRRLNSLSQGGLPQDVAETIVWLAKPNSSGLNGNVVRVCGQSLIGA